MAASPELVLDEATHVYTIGQRTLPSVTQVLSAIDELDGIPRALLERAAHFGRHVHRACDLHNKGLLDIDALDPALAPYFQGWLKFLTDSGARVIASEYRVHHAALGYAGTVDAIVHWESVSPAPMPLDIKSSASIPRSVGPQLVGYRAAYNQMQHPEGMPAELGRVRYCLHLLGDGNYRLKRFTDGRDWAVFLSCLNIWKWRNA